MGRPDNRLAITRTYGIPYASNYDSYGFHNGVRMNEVDRHVTRPGQSCTGLPMLEDALLWAMRAWVIGHARRVDVAERIDLVFDRLGAPGAHRWADLGERCLSRTIH
jgi:hypothetical protein